MSMVPVYLMGYNETKAAVEVSFISDGRERVQDGIKQMQVVYLDLTPPPSSSSSFSSVAGLA
jgi:hypothetical protein